FSWRSPGAGSRGGAQIVRAQVPQQVEGLDAVGGQFQLFGQQAGGGGGGRFGGRVDDQDGVEHARGGVFGRQRGGQLRIGGKHAQRQDAFDFVRAGGQCGGAGGELDAAQAQQAQRRAGAGARQRRNNHDAA